MAKIIDGKQIAADIRNELRDQVTEWVGKGHKRPQLTAVLIGSDPASQTYVSNKMKVRGVFYPEDIQSLTSPIDIQGCARRRD